MISCRTDSKNKDKSIQQPVTEEAVKSKFALNVTSSVDQGDIEPFCVEFDITATDSQKSKFIEESKEDARNALIEANSGSILLVTPRISQIKSCSTIGEYTLVDEFDDEDPIIGPYKSSVWR